MTAGMSTNKSNEIPIDHLDFKYVETCENVKELEKILRTLESGYEGSFPDLERFVFEKIKRLAPNSRVLRRDLPISSKYAMPKEEQAKIDDDLEDFLKTMNNLENSKKLEKSGDEQLPPVRSTAQFVLQNSKANTGAKATVTKSSSNVNSQTSSIKQKSVKPKDYREWAKIEKELEKNLEEQEINDANETKPTVSAKPTKIADDDEPIKLDSRVLKSIPVDIKNEKHLTDEARWAKADQEKCKGNESFNSGSYEEALVYYTRSIQYFPNAASYNNRALAYLKLEKWDKVIEDCTHVLKYEANNVKALLRRSTAYMKKKKYNEALEDASKCVKLEPENKKAIELKSQIEVNLKKENEIKSIGGKRLQIEETDGSSSEGEDDEKELVVKKEKAEKSDEIPKSIIKQEVKSMRIPIAEVETDDDDENDQKEEPDQKFKSTCREVKETDENKPSQHEASSSVSVKTIQPAEPYELPKNVVELKDKAFSLYSQGQYGDSIEIYSKSIETLSDLIQSNKNSPEYSKFLSKTLIVFYNNRASCYEKICDYKMCIRDCDEGLGLFSEHMDSLNENLASKSKLMWKKAHSLEMLEKFADSYKVYGALVRLNSTFKNVQQCYSRVRNVLKDRNELHALESSRLSAETKEKRTEPSQPKPMTYDELKSLGNECVKQNDFVKACEYYTKCIETDSACPLGYLNRSLCHLKLNHPDKAIEDCSFVLEKDKNNVKALYRRSAANKLKKLYSLVHDDLKLLLQIEPNNRIAQQEMNEIKKMLAQPSKERIEVIDEKKNTSQAKVPSTTPVVKTATTTTKSQSSTKKPVSQMPIMTFESTKNKEKLIENFNRITNAYEFLRAWNSISPNDLDLYTKLIFHVKPSNLHEFIGSKLDDDMLTKIIKALHSSIANSEQSQESNKHQLIVDHLKSLTKASRFGFVKMFMSQQVKRLLVELLDAIKTSSNSKEIDLLRNLYAL